MVLFDPLLIVVLFIWSAGKYCRILPRQQRMTHTHPCDTHGMPATAWRLETFEIQNSVLLLFARLVIRGASNTMWCNSIHNYVMITTRCSLALLQLPPALLLCVLRSCATWNISRRLCNWEIQLSAIAPWTFMFTTTTTANFFDSTSQHYVVDQFRVWYTYTTASASVARWRNATQKLYGVISTTQNALYTHHRAELHNETRASTWCPTETNTNYK